MHRVVTVCTRWGDYVLGVHDVRPGESLSVGSPPQPLVRFQCGAARVCPPGEAERELSVGDSVTVKLGELDYTLCCSEPERALTFAPSGRPWALLDAAVLGVLFAALAWGEARAPVVVRDDVGVLAERGPLASPEPAEDQPVHQPIFAVVAEPEAELLRLPGDMRCGGAEMGAYGAETRGRYGVAGPADNADPHLARPIPGQGHPTAHANLGELPQTQPGSSGPTAPFGRDSALATDPTDAHGDMWGEKLNDAWGEDGLGLAGRAGGVVKRFDVAPLADNATAQLRVLHTGLRVTSARKISEVGRVMAARFADFRACAEGVQPGALHSVELDFDVNEAGRAAATGASADPLEECLDKSVAGAAFAPGASEPAHVVYPLHFVAADARLKSAPVARPPSQAACDCG
jgi:hypothetical protein